MNHSISTIRNQARTIFQAGIDAADPELAIRQCLKVAENHFEIGLSRNKLSEKRLGRWSRIHLICVGKAACNMAKTAVQLIPDHRLADTPVVVTNDENKQSLKNIEVISSGHPVPDTRGLAAAKKIFNKLNTTAADELVMVMISGGGSALLPYPATGISLQDKITTTELLLTSGADISQINCVRKHLSQIKGGQLARHAMPADLHSFILSDVIGDDLSAIASGPTAADNTTFFEATKVLNDYHIWDRIPQNVKSFLQSGCQGEQQETAKANAECFKKASYTLIGSNNISLNALEKNARLQGYVVKIYNRQLSGEARKVAEQLVLYTLQLKLQGLIQATAILAGGETTVTVKGTGSGGRNQEMALAFAIAAKKHGLSGKWVFLSASTDGRDGPTNAAGGMVDSNSLKRLKKTRANPLNRLNNNDSYSALKKSQDLIITGATGTNVADFQVLLIQPE